MKATILTLFPEMFPGPLGYSLAGKALEDGVWSLDTVDLKAFGLGKHLQVDDTPYGGGAGMVMRPDAIGDALDSAISEYDDTPHLVYLSPKGALFNQNKALEFTTKKNIVILSARFEGIDERVLQHYPIEEVSLGDFVLFGGETAAMVMLDACVRLLPGVVGDSASLEEDSFSGDFADLLEYPHYTRPDTWNGHTVPDVLLSGNHDAIRAWRLEQAISLTKARRKDLWERYKARHVLDE